VTWCEIVARRDIQRQKLGNGAHRACVCRKWLLKNHGEVSRPSHRQNRIDRLATRCRARYRSDQHRSASIVIQTVRFHAAAGFRRYSGAVGHLFAFALGSCRERSALNLCGAMLEFWGFWEPKKKKKRPRGAIGSPRGTRGEERREERPGVFFFSYRWSLRYHL